jgi:hypothetical protein
MCSGRSLLSLFLSGNPNIRSVRYLLHTKEPCHSHGGSLQNAVSALMLDNIGPCYLCHFSLARRVHHQPASGFRRCQQQNLQHRYIRIHDLCFLPRGNYSPDDTGKRCLECNRVFIEYAPEDTEDQVSPTEQQDIEFRKNLKCQVGQYTIVRLPPDCRLSWKNHKRFRPPPNQRK